MKPPPLLTGAALLFWAALHGNWVAGVTLASVIEAPNLFSFRWELSLRDFTRVWELCLVLLIAGGFYCYVTEDKVHLALVFMEWTPVFLAPLAVAQAFSTTPLLPFSVLNPLHREDPAKKSEPRLNTGFFYFAFCLLAASVSNLRTPWFYPGMSVLMAAVLWVFKPGFGSAPVWCALFLGLSAAGHFTESRLSLLQNYMEGRFASLVAFLAHRMPDTTESWTSIGAVGRRQMSARIALRLHTKTAPPQLLRQAAYNLYRREVWHAPANEAASKTEIFSQLLPENSNSSSWVLRNRQTNLATVQISLYLPGGKGVLPLPGNTFRLDDLPVNFMDTNRFGAVRVSEGPGLASFGVRYSPTPPVAAEPDENDRRPPSPEEIPALDEVIEKLQLRGKPLLDVMSALQNYFSQEFTYSTFLPASAAAKPHESPLAKFLLQTKAGHCEYFATATTLILRQLQFPTRYAVGYAVSESPDKNGEILVREHDAHAWCEVYYNGAWLEFDTTPGSWAAIEAAKTPFWQPLVDFASAIWFAFSKWRWLGSQGEMLRLFWLFIPVAALLIWRIVAGARRQKKNGTREPAGDEALWPGLDSEFYRLEKRLQELGLGRETSEAARHWLNRIRPALPAGVPFEFVNECASLHYRHRFDPVGLSVPERVALGANIQKCLAALTAKPPG